MTSPQRRRPGAGRKVQHTDPAHTFGQWLAEALRERGMNQAEFAEKVGTTPTSVSRWINVRVPEGKYLQKIARVLRLDYDALAVQAGYRPKYVGPVMDPGTPAGEIMPRVDQVYWTEERLAIITAILDAMIESQSIQTAPIASE